MCLGCARQSIPMFNFLNPEAPGLKPREIARSFRWLGWIGFWLQAALGFVPLMVIVSSILFRPVQQRNVFSFGLWLAIACLAALIFSIFWCFRYTQLARQLEDPDARPAKSKVMRDLKLGLVTNFGIMAIAVLIALLRVGELTFKMMTLQQGATVVAPNPIGTTLATTGTLITPSNMIAIQAMVNAMAAGLVGAIVALLLIYQVGQHRRNPA